MKTIEIITSQNVPLQYGLATVFERILAFIIDIAVLYFSFLIFSVFSSEAAYYTFAIGFVFYFFALEVFLNGQTLGKKVLGIKVIKINGYNITTSDYAVRWLMGWVEIFLSGGCLAAFLISSSEKGQRIGDIIANTGVVKIRPGKAFRLNELLNIQTTDNYTPVYTNVVEFSEDEMIIVKNALEKLKKYKNTAHKEAVRSLALIVKERLKIDNSKIDDVTFLRTILKDYIILTR